MIHPYVAVNLVYLCDEVSLRSFMLSSWTALPLQIPFDILICLFLDFSHLVMKVLSCTLVATCEKWTSPAAFCTTGVKHSLLSFPLQKRSLLPDSSAYAVLAVDVRVN